MESSTLSRTMSSKAKSAKPPVRRYYGIVVLLLLIFIAISLVTNILGAIIPDIIDTFHLSLGAAALLPFAFFIAYGIVSIPAGMLAERFHEKRTILAGWLVGLSGALAFALFPSHHIAVGSLFVIGFGMAMLQVVINPLLRVAGGAEHLAFYSALSQFVFGFASFLSPLLYSYLVGELRHRAPAQHLPVRLLARLNAGNPPWLSMYWVFAAVILMMLLVVSLARFPKVERVSDEVVGSWALHANMFRNPVVILYFLSMLAYAGCEQGTANWISKFLSTYHHYNPQTTGATAVSRFWGLMTVGALVGMLFLKLFDSRKVLIACATGALVSLTAALFGSGPVALAAFPAIGLFAACMFPVIFSLALNSIPSHQGCMAGILCTAIAGAALVPLMIGQIGDHCGLRCGLMVLYLTFGWVLSVGFWARPIISNKTIRRERQTVEA